MDSEQCPWPGARTTLISVCFNSTGVIGDLLSSIPTSTPIILVDNNSKDLDQLGQIALDFKATLTSNTSNQGFGVACNSGAQLATTEFLFFVNPDTVIEANTIEQLEKAADRHPQFGAFNPKITGKNGHSQLKRRSCLIRQDEIIPRAMPAEDQVVPVLSGAAIFVRRTSFKAVGGFDSNIFLYHEDDDISYQLRRHIGELWIIPTARVMHLAGQSSSRSAKTASLKAWHMGRSLVYVKHKHNQPRPFATSLLSALLQAISPTTLLSKRKLYKHIGFLKGVISAHKDKGIGHKSWR